MSYLISYGITFFAAFILGMAKAGLKGVSVVVVTLMALVHGAKASTGIILPLLIFADIIAVSYYRRNVNWKLLFRFLPWMIAGVLVGVLVGKDMPEEIFKRGMAVIILISVIIMFAFERYDAKKIPTHWSFAGSMGFAAGFTTMVGNLAGAFANIYFLALRVKKVEFIGTAAFLFFIINLFKLPFHIFSWGTVTWSSLQLGLYLIPGLIIGFLLGLKVVARFKEKQYRIFILVMTAIGAVVMFLR